MTAVTKPKKQLCILVVEDDEDIRAGVVTVLQIAGHLAFSARDGEDAMKQLRALQKPNLILLDLSMPKKDGFQFRALQEMEARFADIPIVVMSADPQADVKSIQLGAKSYLHKPFKIEHLLAAVERYARP